MYAGRPPTTPMERDVQMALIVKQTEEHRRRCPGEGSCIDQECSCGVVHWLICGICGEALFAAWPPDRYCCHVDEALWQRGSAHLIIDEAYRSSPDKDGDL